MHLPSTLIIFIITSIVVNALPAPSSPPHGLLALLRLKSDSHCGIFKCPNGGPSGHAFCQALGCDFCIIVVRSLGAEDYECDGMFRHGTNLTSKNLNATRSLSLGAAKSSFRSELHY